MLGVSGPGRTCPRCPAWCPWPPGSADSALEPRWAILFPNHSCVKALNSSNSNWVLILRGGRFWKPSPGPHNGSRSGSPGATGSAGETHCQHSCVKTLPTAPGSSPLPLTPACPMCSSLSKSRGRTPRTGARRPSAGSDRDAPRRPLFSETGTRGQHSPRQAAPTPRKHALSQEGGSAEARPGPACPDAQASCPAPCRPAHAHTCTRARVHTHTPSHTHTPCTHTHINTLAAGVHVLATCTHSHVELLPHT